MFYRTMRLALLCMMACGLTSLQGCLVFCIHSKTIGLWAGALNPEFCYDGLMGVSQDGAAAIAIVRYSSSWGTNPLNDAKYLLIGTDNPELVMRTNDVRSLLTDDPGNLPDSPMKYRLGDERKIDHPTLPGEPDEFRGLDLWDVGPPEPSGIIFPLRIPKGAAYRMRELPTACLATVPFILADIVMWPVYYQRQMWLVRASI